MDGFWEFVGEQATLHGPVFLICTAALTVMGFAVYKIWVRNGKLSKRNEALSDKLSKVDENVFLEQHKEVVSLLKKVRFDHSANGDMMKCLNTITLIEQQLFEAHLGPGAKDAEGRLKWWGASRMEEILTELTERHEQRIEALQGLRLEEGKTAGRRIDELQELRVAHAETTMREALSVMKSVIQAAKDIHTAVEGLRDLLLRGGTQ